MRASHSLRGARFCLLLIFISQSHKLTIVLFLHFDAEKLILFSDTAKQRGGNVGKAVM